MNKYARWFQWAVWIGVIANLVLAIPGIFAPNWTLAMARQTTSPLDAIWISLASALLVALSIMYLPGAIDPFRYGTNAWLSVLARAGGAARLEQRPENDAVSRLDAARRAASCQSGVAPSIPGSTPAR